MTIRLTTKQKDAIEKRARKEGLSNSNCILNGYFRDKRKMYKTKRNKELSSTLVGINRDLNQLERSLNCCGPHSEEVTELLKQIGEKEKLVWQYLFQ